MEACLAQLMASSLRAAAPYARFVWLIPTTCLCGFASLLYVGYSQKIERSSFELSVIQALKSLPSPAAGAVFLHYGDMRGLAVRQNESDWLLWHAYGRVEWISEMGEQGAAKDVRPGDTQTEKAMTSGDEVLRLEEMVPDFDHVSCYTDILLTGTRLSVINSWAWVLGLHPLPEMKAAVDHSMCAKHAL